MRNEKIVFPEKFSRCAGGGSVCGPPGIHGHRTEPDSRDRPQFDVGVRFGRGGVWTGDNRSRGCGSGRGWTRLGSQGRGDFRAGEVFPTCYTVRGWGADAPGPDPGAGDHG